MLVYCWDPCVHHLSFDTHHIQVYPQTKGGSAQPLPVFLPWVTSSVMSLG